MKVKYLIAMFVSGCTGAGGCEGPGKATSHLSRASIVNNVAQARLTQQGFEFLETEMMDMVKAAIHKPLAVKIPRTPIPKQNPFATLCDRPGGCDAELSVVPGSLDIRRLPPDENGVSRMFVTARFEVTAENVLSVAGDPGHPERDCKIDIAVRDHYPDVCKAKGVSYARPTNIYNPSDSDWATTTKKDCDDFCDAPNPGRAVGAAFLVSVDPTLGYPRVSVESLQVKMSSSATCPAMNDIRVTHPTRPLGAPCQDGTNDCAAFDSTILAQAPFTCALTDTLFNVVADTMHDALLAGATIAINGQLNQVLAVHCENDSQCQPGTTCANATISEGFGCGPTSCLLDPVVAKVCQVGGQIVPPLLGFERAIDMNALSEKYNPNTLGDIKVLAGIGGYLSTDNNDDEDARGIGVGGFFGVEANRSNCVVPRERPTIHQIEPLILQSPATLYDAMDGSMVDREYHASISLHQDALNQLAWAMYTNGALCVTINSNDAGDADSVKLDSSVLAIMFPSLQEVFGPDVHPALMQVSPGELPTFSIGRGELESVNGTTVVKSPHATLDMKKIRLEMYGQVAQRYVRLFTIEANFHVGVFFEFTDDNKLKPFATDIREGLGSVTIDDVVIVGETRDELQKHLPALLDLALPLVAKAILKDYDLPKATVLPGYELKMVGLGGNRQIGETNDYEFLTAYGKLQKIDVMAPTREVRQRPNAKAELVSIEGATLFSAPKVTVALGTDAEGKMEYAHRLNGGLWSVFSSGSTLTLQREQLRINGKHTLEVKSRYKGRLNEVSEVASLSFDMTTKAAVVQAQPEPAPAPKGCAAVTSPLWYLLALAAVRRRRS